MKTQEKISNGFYMAVEDVLADFEGEDFVSPRLIRANRSFNNEGTSLYYYIHGKDSDGLIAGLKLDFFKNIRFSNFKKPHPIEEYRPYFDKFRDGWSCSDDDILQRFVSSSSVTKAQLEKMARHWEVSIEQFINTLLLAYMLLWDAEDDGLIVQIGMVEILEVHCPRKDAKTIVTAG